MTSTFNARATTGTSEEGVDVVCSADRGELGIGLNGSLTLVVEQVIEGGKDTARRRGTVCAFGRT